MRFWYDQHWFESFKVLIFVSFHDRSLNVFPNIWSIVSVQINDLFYHIFVAWVILIFFSVTMQSYGVEILLIRLWSSNIQCFIEIATLRIFLNVQFCIFRENTIIIYFKKFDFNRFLIDACLLFIWFVLIHCSSLLVKTLYLWSLTNRMIHILVKSLIEILLTVRTQESTHCTLAHAWKTNRHKEELIDVRHLALGQVFEQIRVQLIF